MPDSLTSSVRISASDSVGFQSILSTILVCGFERLARLPFLPSFSPFRNLVMILPYTHARLRPRPHAFDAMPSFIQAVLHSKKVPTVLFSSPGLPFNSTTNSPWPIPFWSSDSFLLSRESCAAGRAIPFSFFPSLWPSEASWYASRSSEASSPCLPTPPPPPGRPVSHQAVHTPPFWRTDRPFFLPPPPFLPFKSWRMCGMVQLSPSSISLHPLHAFPLFANPRSAWHRGSDLRSFSPDPTSVFSGYGGRLSTLDLPLFPARGHSNPFLMIGRPSLVKGPKLPS